MNLNVDSSCLLIEGEKSLNGNVYVSGSKNASLKLIACALLTNDTMELTNLPIIDDIYKMKTILEDLGARIDIEYDVINYNRCIKMKINCSEITNFRAHMDASNKIRASIYLLGALVTRFGLCILPLPGGCFSDKRPIDIHIEILKQMGTKIESQSNGSVRAYTERKKLKGIRYKFEKVSVGATVNAVLAATLADGETYLENCAREPEIVDFCKCLLQMGACIEGIGESNLKIIGKEKLNGTKYSVIGDRIEAGTYMLAAAITEGDLTINGIDYSFVENIANKLIEANVEVYKQNDFALRVRVKSLKSLKPIDVITHPYPDFIPTDVQPMFLSLLTLIPGISSVTETVFQDRFGILHELIKIGADLKQVGANKVIINGVDTLHGANVYANDLRACAALVLAGLAANGTTQVFGLKYLDRGYQELEKKLNNCGARIQRKFQ